MRSPFAGHAAFAAGAFLETVKVLLIYSTPTASQAASRRSASISDPFAQNDSEKCETAKMHKRQDTRTMEMCCLLAVPVSLLLTVVFAGMVLG